MPGLVSDTSYYRFCLVSFFQLHDNQPVQSNVETASTNGTISSTMTSTAGSLSFSQANTQGLSGSDEFQQQQFYSPADVNTSQSHMMSMLQQQNNSNSKIPDIVLSGKSIFCMRLQSSR